MEKLAQSVTLESFSYESNKLTESLNILIEKIKESTDAEIKLSNIGELYQKAVLKMVMQLKESGLNYFDIDGFSLFTSIQEFLERHIKKGISHLDRIVEGVTRGEILNSTYEHLSEYKKECAFMENFDLIRELHDILRRRYSTNLYYAYPPGSFRTMLQEDLRTISKFASIDVVSDIKNEFEKIIAEQEATTQDYNNNILVNF